MAKCPDKVLRLVERFEQQADRVRSPDYNETQLRIDYINPLFAALGWDIDNSQDFAEQYREVVHEDRVKVAGQTKAPDYSFRVGGQRKFFLEAKKPAINIKTSPEPAYQLRRYAWSAKLACSLLTDFEEFAIYDTRIRPKHGDRASKARREYISYQKYEERWDFLFGTFSKDAVYKGEFDRYVDSKKGRGAQPFDDAFLEEIEGWRTQLANNLALRNDSLDEPGLNFAVQRIIDRIIFLRIAEDRGTEPLGQLQSLLNSEKTYDQLGKLFLDADKRYNSGLFHFRNERGRDGNPDTLTPTLTVDDRTLKTIIKALYYPDSPYEFTMVSADILGSIYERFLGKVITLTAGHRARIEEKPEVRKAGGVYYTPEYIVDYIVENTVGKLLDGKTVRQAGNITVLDPACGSGSFLIGAYGFLLDWYLAQYREADPAALAAGKNPVLRKTQTGDWALTIRERKRILLTHIHGVDLDGQAVEVTKLNLLLKCLEGETSQTLGFQLKLLPDRALPDLGSNIKCGNSLIGTDIIGTDAWREMSEAERARINPFDYEREFPEVFKGKSPGFDAVIGNPPYGASLLPAEKHSLAHRYPIGTTDTAALFVMRATELAIRQSRIGLIIPKPFTYASNWEKVRDQIHGRLERIVDVGKVWKNVKLEQSIVVVDSAVHKEYYSAGRIGENISIGSPLSKKTRAEFGFFLNSTSEVELEVARKMRSAALFLGDACSNTRGSMLQRQVTKNGNYYILGGKHIRRWAIHLDECSKIDPNKVTCARAAVHSDAVLVQNIVAHVKNPVDHIKIAATFVPRQQQRKLLILDTVNQLRPTSNYRPEYICALLNSRILNWYAYRFLFARAVRTMHFDAITSNRLPLPSRDTIIERSVIEYALRLSELAQLQTEGTHNDAVRDREYSAVENKIEKMLADLYHLTPKDLTAIYKAMP